MRKGPSIGLRVPDGEGVRTRQFKESDITIGRDLGCECTLPSEKVSANHARLTFHHNQWWVEDLGSTNGSFLNGDPVTSPVVVVDGDHLRCGDVVLTITFQI